MRLFSTAREKWEVVKPHSAAHSAPAHVTLDPSASTEQCQCYLLPVLVGWLQVAIPRYDKSQQGGRGDRAPKEAWPVKRGPLDVVLFEGWMLGFSPFSDSKEV